MLHYLVDQGIRFFVQNVFNFANHWVPISIDKSSGITKKNKTERRFTLKRSPNPEQDYKTKGRPNITHWNKGYEKQDG